MGKATDEPEIIPYYDRNLGGVRPGAGRPKGSFSDEKKLLIAKNKEFKQRVAKMTHKLMNSQMTLALGESSLYMKTVKGNKTITTKIDDSEVIIQYLNGDLDSDSDNEYYYITTKSPDNKALDSLLDRAFGKAQQSIDITSGEEPIVVQPVSQTILANFKTYMLESTKEPVDD
jgi:hypothetical protein